MGRDHGKGVREVLPQPGHREDSAEEQDGDRGPVLVVGEEQAEICAGHGSAVKKEVPVVPEEPQLTRGLDQQHTCRDKPGDQDHHRAPSRCQGSDSVDGGRQPTARWLHLLGSH